MNTKCLVASVAGGIVLLVGMYVLYDLLLRGFFEANAGSATGVIKATPNFLWIAVGQLVAGGLLAMVLNWKGATDGSAGAQAGASFGALVSTAHGVTMLGTLNVSTLASTVVDIVVSVVLMGVAGAVVGTILGRGD